MAAFGPNILFFSGGSKSFGTCKEEKQLGTSFALVFGGAWHQMGQKGQYVDKISKVLAPTYQKTNLAPSLLFFWPSMAPNGQQRPIFAPKWLNDYFWAKNPNVLGREEKFGQNIGLSAPLGAMPDQKKNANDVPRWWVPLNISCMWMKLLITYGNRSIWTCCWIFKCFGERVFQWTIAMYRFFTCLFMRCLSDVDTSDIVLLKEG